MSPVTDCMTMLTSENNTNKEVVHIIQQPWTENTLKKACKWRNYCAKNAKVLGTMTEYLKKFTTLEELHAIKSKVKTKGYLYSNYSDKRNRFPKFLSRFSKSGLQNNMFVWLCMYSFLVTVEPSGWLLWFPVCSWHSPMSYFSNSPFQKHQFHCIYETLMGTNLQWSWCSVGR
jgi:hypothetical protein